NIVEQVHRELGHTGERKTEHAVRQRFWWPSIHEDVAQFCKNCNTCYRFKLPQQTPRAPMTPMVTTGPHQRVGIDIMGPLTTTKNGNCYIPVMVDYFTKWCEAVPIPQQDALTVAQAFINHWVSRYGAPVSLHSDQGPSLESHLITEICRLLGIRKTHTTAYHPEGNGLVDRTNRTIKAILQSFVSRSSPELWDEVLSQCLLTYRTSCRRSGLTYGGELKLSVRVSVNGSPLGVLDVPCGVLPVMVMSRSCNLSSLPRSQFYLHGEEVKEIGGYFIVHGKERVLRNAMRILIRLKDDEYSSQTRALCYLGGLFRRRMNVPDRLSDEEAGKFLLRRFDTPPINNYAAVKRSSCF
ncbi:unnamed protein product, partial [Schistosoma curassoni]|uniref:DNA-directed RNA polymerase n=1 Tax=Schistosoma curassoni TaxID=6186 RepID=A0A183KTH1_9TREM